MHSVLKLIGAAAAIGVSVVSAAPHPPQDKRSFVERDGQNFTVFEHGASGAKIEFVTNSGICETTPGVNQYSGYLSVGTNMNMWFWFFEARNSPATAPLATWLNGGPGCSSMIGLFQENGPCQFANGDSQPSLNPYSWNEYANMIYIDQPIGAGFSYGNNPVTSTVTAAPYVWNLLQAFYANFPQYENRDFGLFTESYGGHYGPEFASCFQRQNKAITAGTINGTEIPIVALGVNNYFIDPVIQYKSHITFAQNNTYRSVISAAKAKKYFDVYNNECIPALKKCTGLTGNNAACVNAENVCYDGVEGAIANEGDFGVYDIRQPRNDPFPPTTYVRYLRSSAVVKAIGAKSTYQECANAPFQAFSRTGDISRSFLPTLSEVVRSGITVLLWAGNADWICAAPGNEETANAVQWAQTAAFATKNLTSYTVNGTVGGLFKTLGNLSWLEVFEAGHKVMYYQPELSLQAFKQTMGKKPLSST